MALYRIWLHYEPDYWNPLTGRHGRWRVVSSSLLRHEDALIYADPEKGMMASISTTKELPGTIINPTKELKRVLQQYMTEEDES